MHVPVTQCWGPRQEGLRASLDSQSSLLSELHASERVAPEEPHLWMSSGLHTPKGKERQLVPACTGHGPLELSLVPGLADTLPPLEDALCPFVPSGQVWASSPVICTGIGECGDWVGNMGVRQLRIESG